jgi:hypothetical protein
MTKEERAAYNRQWRAAHPGYNRSLRLLRRANALCDCCNNKALPGMSSCEHHLSLTQKSDKRYRLSHLEQGRIYAAQQRSARVKQHRCVSCGRPLTEETTKKCFNCCASIHIPWWQRRKLKVAKVGWDKVYPKEEKVSATING